MDTLMNNSDQRIVQIKKYTLTDCCSFFCRSRFEGQEKLLSCELIWRLSFFVFVFVSRQTELEKTQITQANLHPLLICAKSLTFNTTLDF